MFKISSETCEILKSVKDLVKAQNTSVQAGKKSQNVVFTEFNSDSNILFYHQTVAEVTEPKKFAVATDRLVSLLCGRGSTDITLDYNGSGLNYGYRKSKGTVETHTFETHERPAIQSDKALTNLVRKHFSLLSLKVVVEGTETFIFVEEFPTYTQICVSDSGGYHAVVLKIDAKNETSNQIAVPLPYVQGAIKTLKENIQMCNDAENLYCYTKDKSTVSILRFRNILDTRGITAQVLTDAINCETLLAFNAPATLFNDILADYEVIKDPERGGVITVVIEDGGIELKCETRHGSCSSKPPVQVNVQGTHSFNLATKILPDVLKLKGEVKFSLKKDMNIFSIQQQDTDAGMETTYIMTCERIKNAKT